MFAAPKNGIKAYIPSALVDVLLLRPQPYYRENSGKSIATTSQTQALWHDKSAKGFLSPAMKIIQHVRNPVVLQILKSLKGLDMFFVSLKRKACVRSY